MSLGRVVERFGLEETPSCWAEAYHEVAQGADQPELPNPALISEYASWLGFPAELTSQILETLAAVRRSPKLRTAWSIVHHLLFASERRESVPETAFPVPELRLFYAPLFLAEIPNLLALHSSMGVPEEETRLLLLDLPRWIEEYRRRHGSWGLGEMKWLRHHFWGDLLQIGVLQYQPREFLRPFRLFAARSSGETVALVEGGRRIRSDGRFADADASSLFCDHPPLGELAEPTVYEAKGRRVRAHSVSSDGLIASVPATFDLSDYDRLVSSGDRVAAIHIPQGTRFDPVSVTESLDAARAVLPSRFDEPDFHGFTCDSWLLDPQLGEYLGVESNIVAFAALFHRLPLPGADDRQHFERVFGVEPESLTDAERPALDNRLKRALFAHVDAGRCWRITGGVIPF